MNTVVIRDWRFTCEDGCCDEWGTDILVNGVNLDLMSNPEDHLCETIQAVLTALGVEAIVSEVVSD